MPTILPRTVGGSRMHLTECPSAVRIATPITELIGTELIGARPVTLATAAAAVIRPRCCTAAARGWLVGKTAWHWGWSRTSLRDGPNPECTREYPLSVRFRQLAWLDACGAHCIVSIITGRPRISAPQGRRRLGSAPSCTPAAPYPGARCAPGPSSSCTVSSTITPIRSHAWQQATRCGVTSSL